jgi:phosphatidate phosphatase LPIN
VKQDYSMKLGEGGEAFFVFETSANIPEDMQTSPLVSPASSPESKPLQPPPNRELLEPDPLDLDAQQDGPHFGGREQSAPVLDTGSQNLSGGGTTRMPLRALTNNSRDNIDSRL